MALNKVRGDERMLLEFSCSNYKSIKDKVTFSMLAGKDDTYAERLIPFSNQKVLRSAVIYGANGSGKSNFLNALGFMCKLVSVSMQHQPGDGILQNTHKLSEEGTETEYTIQFVKNGIRYAYGFSIKNSVIETEYLFYFPKGRSVKIFERTGMTIIPGDRYKGSFKLSLDALKENRLFLSCAANYTQIDEISNAFLFFREDLIIYNPEINNWEEYSINVLSNNEETKALFIQILRALGIAVKDVKVKIEKAHVEDLPSFIPEEMKKILATGEFNKTEAKLIYDQFETDLRTEESSGVKKLFQIICPVIDIISKGKILVCDEFEHGLHESLVCEIVKLFNSTAEKSNAQIIFSTHDTSLLNADLFRRDQIWFTEMISNERKTDLYSLVAIKNVRKVENLERGYISGKYGAIPMLNDKVIHLFESKIND